MTDAQYGRGRTVLLCEAAEAMRRALASYLRGAGCDRVLTAESITAAEAIVRREALDLAILDWQAPDGSGFDLAERIRFEGVGPEPDLAVVLTTWHPEAKSLLAAQGLGVKLVVVKPVSKSDFDRRIASVLRPKAAVNR